MGNYTPLCPKGYRNGQDYYNCICDATGIIYNRNEYYGKLDSKDLCHSYGTEEKHFWDIFFLAQNSDD